MSKILTIFICPLFELWRAQRDFVISTVWFIYRSFTWLIFGWIFAAYRLECFSFSSETFVFTKEYTLFLAGFLAVSRTQISIKLAMNREKLEASN